jgi:exopolyphosphatase/guanosine-5'-triphosphate,3'-diphosphate pyrophosphatase
MSDMKIASIDIGSNSFILLITEIIRGEIFTLHQEFAIPRMGENLAISNHISQEALLRSIEVLHHFKNILTEYKPDIKLPVATAVLRDAVNGKEIQNILSDALGSHIQVICGEDEALFSFLGVSGNIHHQIGTFSTIDIGGGSTEIISGSKDKIRYKTSLPLGAAALRDLFFKDNQYSELNLLNSKNYIQNVISKVTTADIESSYLVGVGGTITTLAYIKTGSREYNAEMIDKTILSKSDLMQFFINNINLSPEIISNKYYINPKRADILLPGLLILMEIMIKIGIDSLHISSRGLRYGIIQHYLNNSL